MQGLPFEVLILVAEFVGPLEGTYYDSRQSMFRSQSLANQKLEIVRRFKEQVCDRRAAEKNERDEAALLPIQSFRLTSVAFANAGLAAISETLRSFAKEHSSNLRMSPRDLQPNRHKWLS